MTYSVEQVQRGLANYIDSEFTAKLSGWQKWVVGAAGAVYSKKLRDVIEVYRHNKAVELLGILPEDGGIDVDTAYQALLEQAQKSSVTFEIPLIGNVTLNERDVRSLYENITRA